MTRRRRSDAARDLADALLAPTRLYIRSGLAAIRSGGVKGFAHITGGGVTENLRAPCPTGINAEIELDAWTPPPVFGWLARQAGIGVGEMLRRSIAAWASSPSSMSGAPGM
ncbi:MAG: AIR synthase-related protein [Rhizomicrobium sp.]